MGRLGPERVRTATAWRFAYLLIQGGLSTVVFVALAQVLPSAEFAAAAVAQGVLVISQAIGDFGLSQATVTALPSRIAADPASRTALLAGAARGFFYASGLAIMLTLAAVTLVPGPADSAVAAIAPAAAASVIVSGADGLLRSEGEFHRPVLLVLWSRLGALAAVPAALIADSAVWACGFLAIGACVGAVPALRAVTGTSRLSDRPRLRPSFEAALPLAVAQIFTVATGRLNTIAVSSLSGLTAGAAFESTWRLFQLGQYIAGGIATALAPFVGTALGAGSGAEFHKLVRRGTWRLMACGVAWTAVLVILRDPLAHMFGGDLEAIVADAIIPLAVVVPISFVGFLAIMTLAMSPPERAWIIFAHVTGAALNLGVLVGNGSDPSPADAALGAAVGIGVTSSLLICRMVTLARRVEG